MYAEVLGGLMAEIVTSGYDYSAILQPYMPVFYVSFLATLTLTPLMQVLAHRHGVVDSPDGKRKVHTKPIAYLGGVSIFLGWLAGVTLAVFLRPHNYEQIVRNTIEIPPGVVLGAATVVLFGLMDDVFSLSPKFKLLGQFLAALLLVLPGLLPGVMAGSDFFLGTEMRVGNAGSQTAMHFGPAWMIINPLKDHGIVPMSWVSSEWFVALAGGLSAVTVIAVVMATCNATNLLDGLDGLCSGVTGVMSVGYLILAVYLAHSYVPTAVAQPIDPTRITLSLALLGAVLGFLPFNFNPASIFMGDTGSMFLGYICGTMILLFGQHGTAKWFLSAIIIFGLPMMDTFLAIVRRKLNKKRIFAADSNHFHHFLIKRGMSVRRAVVLSYGIAALFVSFGLVIVIMPTSLAIGIYLVLFAWIVVVAFKIGMIFESRPSMTTNSELNLSVVAPLAAPKEKVVEQREKGPEELKEGPGVPKESDSATGKEAKSAA